MKLCVALAALGLIGVITPAVAKQTSPYAVTQTWNVGGDGGWDYASVDTATHRLFIARNDRVLVLDTRSGKLLATIAGMQHAHGVALAPSLGKAFVSNGDSGNVSVVDLTTLKLMAQIPTGAENPDAIVYDTHLHRVITMNGRSKSVSIIDPDTGNVEATVAVPGKPEFAAVDGRGTLWANIEDTSQLVRIDLQAHKLVATWSLAPCESPSGLAFDDKARRLFSVCDNGWMAVTDADSGRQVAHLAIGSGPDAAAYDAATHTVFSSNRDGTLSLFRQRGADTYDALPAATTRPTARTMALDNTTHTVYLPFATSAEKGQPVQGFGVLVASPVKGGG